MQKIQMNPKQDVTLSKAKDLFFQRCKVKNLSDDTLRSYNDNFHWLFLYFGEDRLVSSITESDIGDYSLYLKNDRQLSDITCNTYLRGARALFYYCMDCGYMKRFKIHLMKQQDTIKETYTDEELQRLLAKPDKSKVDFTTYKIWAFENYLLGTGNRMRTAMNLKIEDIDFQGGFITLRKTKNRKAQIIPLSHTLAEVLTEYLMVRGGSPEDYVFCDAYGGKATTNSYQIAVRKYNIRHNVNKTSCHLFRHTFAKKAVLNGIDVFRLQKLMGHSSISITQKYVDLFGADLQNDYDKFSPLDSLMGSPESKKRINMN